jgi:diguanylate cyclase (GGDEF)-like protein
MASRAPVEPTPPLAPAAGETARASTHYSLPPRRPGQHVRDHALLLILEGPQRGALFPLQARTSLIGRDSDADLCFGDESVSRHHALLSMDSRGIYVEDLGSRNGTFLNERRVTGRTPIADGDHLRVGDTTVKFSMTDDLEERALTTLVALAERDPLTGAFNRRHLERHLRSELAFAARHGTTLSLVLFDIDHFKRVNDTYGHHAGDVVLQLVAASIQRVLRPYDALCRFGGEEFMVIARDTTPRNSEILAERIRARIGALPFDFAGQRFEVTVSAGVVSTVPGAGDASVEELFDAVDAALYRAKRGGRNRVVIGKAPEHGATSEVRARTGPPSSNGEPAPADPPLRPAAVLRIT